jgi:hypothetical protein
MELRDFAEQILFSMSLDDKLRGPQNITDNFAGAGIIAPAFPGRPAGLRFKPKGIGKGDFPSLHHLEREE